MMWLIDLILSLFRRPIPPIPTMPVAEPPLVLPHPEEPPNYTLMDLDYAMSDWLDGWDVPIDHWDYWRNSIVINVTETIPYPAQAWEQDGIRHLDVRPEWVNPGVIAHEQAHNSYALLTNEGKAEFYAIYTPLITTDPVIKLLYSINTYGLTNIIEGHAEVYRYIGQYMPESLRKYYPKLF